MDSDPQRASMDEEQASLLRDDGMPAAQQAGRQKAVRYPYLI
eukprot:COSAG05_NODE_12592_length_462_cov_0.856749_1_plen_41_part_10